MDHEYSLNHRLLSRHANPVQPTLCRIALDDLHSSEDLKAGLSRIVDHDDRDAIVRKQVSCADVLFISAKISKRQGVVVDHLEETLGTAAMLDIGPSRRSRRGPVKAVSLGQEL